MNRLLLRIHRPDDGRRTLAASWLAGELDAAVDVPVAVVCGVLDLDATALAAPVHKRARP